MTVQAGRTMTPPSTETSTSTLSPETGIDNVTIEQLNDLEEMKKIGEWAKSEYTRAKMARASIERQWYLNMAFYQGRQWVTFMPNASQTPGLSNRLVTPPAPPYRVRSVVNRVRSVVRTELSRMTSNKPNASVVPASSEDEDLFAAQAGEQVWESLYATKNLPTVFKRAAFWTSVCGVGYVKCWWDKNVVTKDSTGKECRGDIQYAPVSPFHLYVPDLTEEELENQPYVINAYTKPVEWLKQAFGRDFSPSVVAANEIVENGFLNLAAAGKEAKPDSCLVLEVWVKAGGSKYFPQGGMVTVVDSKVVQIKRDGLPYAHKQYPFIKFENMPTGGYYPASVIEDVIPIQRELNRTRSQIIEAKNRMAKPQLIAPKGSVDPAKITSEPGIVIQYRPGLAPPQPLPLQPLPGYVLQEIDRSLADIEDVTSQHQVSKGAAPPGVTAATAISYLQERDDSVLAPTYQSIEAGWEKIAKQSMSHVVQFWEVKRTIQVTGVDGSFDSIALKGADIEKGLDIRVEAGSALPVSKAARQALLMDLMSQGMLDPKQGMKMMEIGGVKKLYEELAVDERQAQRENLRMRSLEIQDIEAHMQQAQAELDAQTMQPPMPGMEGMMPPGMPGMPPQMGQPPMQQGTQSVDMQSGEPLLTPQSMIPVNTWDNHEVHIEVHNRFRKGQAFELLPDEIKAQFEAHVSMHAMALNQSAQQAQMMPPPEGNPLTGDLPPGMDQMGANQFGPPGTEGAAPPPDMGGMQ